MVCLLMISQQQSVSQSIFFYAQVPICFANYTDVRLNDDSRVSALFKSCSQPLNQVAISYTFSSSKHVGIFLQFDANVVINSGSILMQNDDEYVKLVQIIGYKLTDKIATINNSTLTLKIRKGDYQGVFAQMTNSLLAIVNSVFKLDILTLISNQLSLFQYSIRNQCQLNFVSGTVLFVGSVPDKNIYGLYRQMFQTSKSYITQFTILFYVNAAASVYGICENASNTNFINGNISIGGSIQNCSSFTGISEEIQGYLLTVLSYEFLLNTIEYIAVGSGVLQVQNFSYRNSIIVVQNRIIGLSNQISSVQSILFENSTLKSTQAEVTGIAQQITNNLRIKELSFQNTLLQSATTTVGFFQQVGFQLSIQDLSMKNASIIGVTSASGMFDEVTGSVNIGSAEDLNYLTDLSQVVGSLNQINPVVRIGNDKIKVINTFSGRIKGAYQLLNLPISGDIHVNDAINLNTEHMSQIDLQSSAYILNNHNILDNYNNTMLGLTGNVTYTQQIVSIFHNHSYFYNVTVDLDGLIVGGSSQIQFSVFGNNVLQEMQITESGIIGLVTFNNNHQNSVFCGFFVTVSKNVRLTNVQTVDQFRLFSNAKGAFFAQTVESGVTFDIKNSNQSNIFIEISGDKVDAALFQTVRGTISLFKLIGEVAVYRADGNVAVISGTAGTITSTNSSLSVRGNPRNCESLASTEGWGLCPWVELLITEQSGEILLRSKEISGVRYSFFKDKFDQMNGTTIFYQSAVFFIPSGRFSFFLDNAIVINVTFRGDLLLKAAPGQQLAAAVVLSSSRKMDQILIMVTNAMSSFECQAENCDVAFYAGVTAGGLQILGCVQGEQATKIRGTGKAAYFVIQHTGSLAILSSNVQRLELIGAAQLGVFAAVHAGAAAIADVSVAGAVETDHLSAGVGFGRKDAGAIAFTNLTHQITGSYRGCWCGNQDLGADCWTAACESTKLPQFAYNGRALAIGNHNNTRISVKFDNNAGEPEAGRSAEPMFSGKRTFFNIYLYEGHYFTDQQNADQAIIQLRAAAHTTVSNVNFAISLENQKGGGRERYKTGIVFARNEQLTIFENVFLLNKIGEKFATCFASLIPHVRGSAVFSRTIIQIEGSCTFESCDGQESYAGLLLGTDFGENAFNHQVIGTVVTSTAVVSLGDRCFGGILIGSLGGNLDLISFSTSNLRVSSAYKLNGMLAGAVKSALIEGVNLISAVFGDIEYVHSGIFVDVGLLIGRSGEDGTATNSVLNVKTNVFSCPFGVGGEYISIQDTVNVVCGSANNLNLTVFLCPKQPLKSAVYQPVFVEFSVNGVNWKQVENELWVIGGSEGTDLNNTIIDFPAISLNNNSKQSLSMFNGNYQLFVNVRVQNTGEKAAVAGIEDTIFSGFIIRNRNPVKFIGCDNRLTFSTTATQGQRECSYSGFIYSPKAEVLLLNCHFTGQLALMNGETRQYDDWMGRYSGFVGFANNEAPITVRYCVFNGQIAGNGLVTRSTFVAFIHIIDSNGNIQIDNCKVLSTAMAANCRAFTYLWQSFGGKIALTGPKQLFADGYCQAGQEGHIVGL